MNNLKFVLTKFGKQKVIINEYEYHFHRSQKLTLYFKYRVKDCGASVTIDKDESADDRIKRLNDNHEHSKTASEDDFWSKK